MELILTGQVVLDRELSGIVGVNAAVAGASDPPQTAFMRRVPGGLSS